MMNIKRKFRSIINNYKYETFVKKLSFSFIKKDNLENYMVKKFFPLIV